MEEADEDEGNRELHDAVKGFKEKDGVEPDRKLKKERANL